MLPKVIHKAFSYWRSYGFLGLCRAVIAKLTKRPRLFHSTSKRETVMVRDIFIQALTPLRVYAIPSTAVSRLNMITDSVGSSHLFGGVGTALIFSALLANEMNASLRIITRTEVAKPANVKNILSLYDIQLKHEIEFKFCPPWDKKMEIDMASGDKFISTSWWTTASILPSVPHQSIIYLLQEDERMFYAFEDSRLQCEKILKSKDIRFLINTKLLFDHFIKEGFDNISQQGVWFEPAFPSHIYFPRKKNPLEKKKLFFYARPNNVRNLFYLGMAVLDQALEAGVIDTTKWDILLVGKDLPSIQFTGGYTPIKCEGLNWTQYAELIGTVDVGLSLMYTPHPSYPPLDLVASGAVVVTNRFANKQDLTCYSENLICADLDQDLLVLALQQAILLSQDSAFVQKNYAANRLLSNWKQAFSSVLGKIMESA